MYLDSLGERDLYLVTFYINSFIQQIQQFVELFWQPELL